MCDLWRGGRSTVVDYDLVQIERPKPISVAVRLICETRSPIFVWDPRMWFDLWLGGGSTVFDHDLVSEKPSNKFSIYMLGSEFPEWSSYQSLGSLVNIQVLRHDLVNKKLMGFAICAVLRPDEYCSRRYSSFSEFYFSNLEKLLAGDNDYVDISFEFDANYEGCNQLKCCAVHPIFADPIEKIGATIEDIGECGKRSGQSDDNEEEVEPHPKRICTQPN
ncbi:hypothetical protein LWI29_030667 [Acer saccharum]|uniref:C-JID domain-containing protein n=1 Tax=Acer saccharum TaxID=4024 RepID=A0AA39W0W1_ACESA|nr:hypothetical protein LWI29_030667 [Acer saccharum]